RERAWLCRKELQRDLGAGRPRVDLRERLFERRGSPSPEVLPLEHHLGGVDEREALQLSELALALRKLALPHSGPSSRCSPNNRHGARGAPRARGRSLATTDWKATGPQAGSC